MHISQIHSLQSTCLRSPLLLASQENYSFFLGGRLCFTSVEENEQIKRGEKKAFDSNFIDQIHQKNNFTCCDRFRVLLHKNKLFPSVTSPPADFFSPYISFKIDRRRGENFEIFLPRPPFHLFAEGKRKMAMVN